MILAAVVDAAVAWRNMSVNKTGDPWPSERVLIAAVEAYDNWLVRERAEGWHPCASKGLDRPCELAAPGYSNCARCTQDIMYP